MDKADISRATSKDESDSEDAPQNDTAKVGTCPTFLDWTHQCVSGI